jgi:hypothetical protein
MKKYLLVRWKKRWPTAVLAPIFVLFYIWAEKELHGYVPVKEVRRGVLMIVIFVAIGILFPFHWGRENWDDDGTK